MVSALEALTASGADFEFAQGYAFDAVEPDEALIAQAAALAAQKDKAVVFAGLPDAYESEGFDRPNIAMPLSHVRLIEAVAEANPNTVVVLMGGAPMEMTWLDRVKSVLLCYLGGQMAGEAAAQLLLGKANPCGKLPETLPLHLEDNPSYAYFPGDLRVEYRESVFVGYRFYEAAGVPVLFPFGHGLSYTAFAYDNARIQIDGGETRVYVDVTNTGAVEGHETVQLYVAGNYPGTYGPQKELRAFEKVLLAPGETQSICLTLPRDCFSRYDAAKGWIVTAGRRRLLIGSSSADIRCHLDMDIAGEAPSEDAVPQSYAAPRAGMPVTDEDFYGLAGVEPKPAGDGRTPFTINSTLAQAKKNPVGAHFIQQILQGMAAGDPAQAGSDISRMFEAMFADMPLRALVLFSGGKLTLGALQEVVIQMNQAQ